MSPTKEKAKEYTNKLVTNTDRKKRPSSRLLVATPTLGLVRMEWVLARHGQIIPTNWGMVQFAQYMNTMAPLGFAVADAQNVIVKQVIDGDYEWLLLVEDDVVLPADAFVRFNEYMRKEDPPVVSGLYFTKSQPPEPVLYRGRGTSYFADFDIGDKVWVDGVPTGCLLVHGKILKVLWDESPEYMLGTTLTRRVFDQPAKVWRDPETSDVFTETGTSDLQFCTRLMKDDIFTKAGWPDVQKKKYPFLVDTNINCRHIGRDGRMYP